MTLADFLLARIAEEEATAREVAEATSTGGYVASIVADHPELAAGDCPAYLADYEAARVIAQCEALRSVVEDCVYYDDSPEVSDGLSGRTLEHLALPYAEHPDYDESWRPDEAR